MKHRAEDSKRLLQRNTNLLKDMLSKQTQEQRRTELFLNYALGKRELKTEDELNQQIKDSAYKPANDPLMARASKRYNAGVAGGNRANTTDSRSGSKFL